jgi:predicted HTH domain antitoxin
MTINIPDDILRQIGPTERDVLIEIACRLYDAEKIEKPQATRLCGLSRVELEDELAKRGLAVYRATLEDYELDRASLGDAPVRKAG